MLADVRRGIWKPPAPAAVERPKEEPTFHEFASEWFVAREAEGLAAKTLVDLKWSLSNHLLLHFADLRLSAIDAREVDRYKTAKTIERKDLEERLAAWEKADPKERGPRPPRALSNASINHTLRHLSQILETAVEYGLIDSNRAAGKRRRLKAAKPARLWVEPEQLPALLHATSGAREDAARDPRRRRPGDRRGARPSLAARGARHRHSARCRLEDGEGRPRGAPDAGAQGRAHARPRRRERPEAGRLRDRDVDRSQAQPVEPPPRRAHAGGGEGEHGAREGWHPPIGRVTFHSLRRTYASLRCACGDDVRYTADQLGHEDPRFTLRVYAQATKRRDRLTGAHLKAYDRALEWARMGTNEPLTVPTFDPEATKAPFPRLLKSG